MKHPHEEPYEIECSKCLDRVSVGCQCHCGLVNRVRPKKLGFWFWVRGLFLRKRHYTKRDFRAEVPPTKQCYYLFVHAGQPGEMGIIFLDWHGMVHNDEGEQIPAQRLVDAPVPYKFGPMITLHRGEIRLERW